MSRVSNLTQKLPFLLPYDWEAVLAFFRGHQISGIENVDAQGFERVVNTRQGLGWFRVERDANGRALSLTVWNGVEKDLQDVSTSVRRMFDLDANPTALLETMNNDTYLSQFWARHPGLRLTRPWSASESLFTTVLGQLVSVNFGRVLTGELMRAAGTIVPHPKTGQMISLFPSAEEICRADLSSVRTSEARRTTIRTLAHAIQSGAFQMAEPRDVKKLRKTLRNITGVGAWTAEYVAMRGFGDDDAFPATDYALKQELKRHPEIDVNSVRPLRGYAAVALWRSFAGAKQSAFLLSKLQTGP